MLILSWKDYKNMGLGIDEQSKVQLFLAAIKTQDLDTVKTRSLSDKNLWNDFAACVNLFQDFIGQKADMAGGLEMNISAVKTHHEQQLGDAVMMIADKYYNQWGYAKLTHAQKNGLWIKHKKQGHKTGDQSKRKPNAKSQIKSGKGLSGKQAKTLIALILQQSRSGQDKLTDAGQSTFGLEYGSVQSDKK